MCFFKVSKFLIIIIRTLEIVILAGYRLTLHELVALVASPSGLLSDNAEKSSNSQLLFLMKIAGAVTIKSCFISRLLYMCTCNLRIYTRKSKRLHGPKVWKVWNLGKLRKQSSGILANRDKIGLCKKIKRSFLVCNERSSYVINTSRNRLKVIWCSV